MHNCKSIYNFTSQSNTMTTTEIKTLIYNAVMDGGVEASIVNRCLSAIETETGITDLVTDIVFDGHAQGKYVDLFYSAYKTL